jgi:hypothetical protein
MAGIRGKVILAVLVLLGTTSPAQAWWWGWRGWGWHGRGYYSYYTPAYYYAYYPAYPAYPVCPTMMTVAPPQPMPPAQKIAEPSGQTKEPALMGDTMKKGPTITEARSMGGAYAQAGNSKERCKVGFWNLTGRDVTLKIDGQQRLVPKDRAVTLDLDRAFAWQVDQGDTVTERVPSEQPFHEVILRQ